MSSDDTNPAVATANSAFDNIPEQFVPLNQIGIAPENLRASEPPDDEIPQLAETLFVGGQLFPLFVRPARGKKELPFMALDGRRRRYGFFALLEAGRIAEDHPVRVKVLTDPALQVAAAMLPNTETMAPDLVDVIQAVGRMSKRKLSPADIARALGYKRQEVLGWTVLADLDPSVLTGVRQGRITLKQAKLLTKLSPDDQRQIAENARTYGTLYDATIRSRLNGTLVTVADRRVRLAGLENYKGAGGRIDSDLFGEEPDVIVDPAILQQTWDAQARPVIEALKAEGLEVFLSDYRTAIPEGFKALPYRYTIEVPDDEAENIDALESKVHYARNEVSAPEAFTDATRATLLDLVTSDLDFQRALHDTPIAAATLIPDARTGVEVVFHAADLPLEDIDEVDQDEDDGAAAPSPGIARVRKVGDIQVPTVELDPTVATHALNERYTDLATRGLLRALADDPHAALILLIARLFAAVGLQSSGDVNASISTLEAKPYQRSGAPPIDCLDGDVCARLDARREAYLASGERPIPWIAALTHGERMQFLAELMAMSLNGREFATHAKRHGARAEAVEVRDLTNYDMTDHWVPDVEFFGAHNKRQLLEILQTMGADTAPATGLKKDDLAAYTADAAEERRWAPAALSWRAQAPPATAADVEDAPEEKNGNPTEDGSAAANEPGPGADIPVAA
jgi:ParB family transcriptional regulator, chromosome partitioning protein